MVPLLVGPQGSANAGLVPKTSIELAWLSTLDALGKNGTLVLNPPQVDLPVSALSVEIQFPEGYLVNFSGSLLQAEKFSQRQPRVVNYETGQDMTTQEFNFNSMPRQKSSSGSKAGVKSKAPKAGTRHVFEQLLVVNGSAALSVAYSTPPSIETRSWSSRFWSA